MPALKRAISRRKRADRTGSCRLDPRGPPFVRQSWNQGQDRLLQDSSRSNGDVSTERCDAESAADGSSSRTPHPSTYSNAMPARLSPSRHLRVGRSKSGLGLFARAPIKKGQFIIRYRGKKIRTEDTEDARHPISVRDQQSLDDRRLQPEQSGPLHQSCLPAERGSLFRQARDQDPCDQEHQAR